MLLGRSTEKAQACAGGAEGMNRGGGGYWSQIAKPRICDECRHTGGFHHKISQKRGSKRGFEKESQAQDSRV